MEYQVRLWVQKHPGATWCPSPDCPWAVSAAHGHGADDVVTCGAGHKFCFACQREPHKPSSCDEVRKWSSSDATEGATASWIVANTKQCPKC